MATFRSSAYRYIPDNSGNVYEEPADVTRTTATWKATTFIFVNSSTKDSIHFRFNIPQNYSGIASLIVVWTSGTTSGDVDWSFRYRAHGGNDAESLNQASEQENLTTNLDTAPTSAFNRMELSIDLIDGNFTAGDTVLCELSRDGSSAYDSLAADVHLEDVFFQYNDV